MCACSTVDVKLTPELAEPVQENLSDLVGTMPDGGASAADVMLWREKIDLEYKNCRNTHIRTVEACTD